MKFYKIVQDHTIVGAGYEFMQWNSMYNMMIMCDVNDAQFLQSYTDSKYYHTRWLGAVPSGIPYGTYEEADIFYVTPEEYDEIIATLIGGETIIEPDDTEPTPEPSGDDDEPAPDERPMTIAEMRKTIEELMALVNNSNEPFKATKDYYKDDIIVNGPRVYRADQTIIKDETVVPGGNCTETTIADVLNALQAQQ